MNAASSRSRYKLVNSNNAITESEIKGTIGGYRRGKYRIYGRLDCANALGHIAKGNYVAYRVFFLDEETAIAAGYRPCYYCMRKQYDAWNKLK